MYERVSTSGQRLDVQHGDLTAWVEYQGKQAPTQTVLWYADKASGKRMSRPSFDRLLKAVRPGDTVVCWRMDRLGRNAAGLLDLLERWQVQGVKFVSIRDALDTSTAAGRLLTTVLAGVAQFETECRAERIEAARATREARGERINRGGRPKGSRHKVTAEQVEQVRQLRDSGTPVAVIARTVGLSRPTVYGLFTA